MRPPGRQPIPDLVPARRRTTRRAPAKKTTTATAPRPAPPPVIPPGHRLHLLDVPYPERAIASLHGARWNADLRATTYLGADLPAGLQPYASAPFSWERWQEDDLNAEPGPVPEAAHTLIPRPHQDEAAQAIAKAGRIGARGFLLADEVGTGKTISALEGVLALRNIRPVTRLLVFSPLAVVPHWRRSIADMGIAEHGIRVCVINWDRAKKLLEVPASAATAKRTATKNRRIAREGKPLVDWDVVIADEAHQLRNFATAQRAQAFARIAGYGQPRDKAPFVIWTSATAGQTPLELGYLAPLFAQITGSKGSELRDFGPWLEGQGFHVTHESRFDRWLWTDDPRDRVADVARMRAMLFERSTPVALRRLPTDLAGWPEIVRALHPVTLDPEARRLYDQAWTAFRKEMKLATRGKDPKAGMVARLRFRQKASLLRVDGTVSQALDLLDNGHQVAISAQFLETVDAIADALRSAKVPVAVMDGRDPASRETQRLAFQTGAAKAVIFTPVEGFSLHQEETLADGSLATAAPRSVIIHDPRFSGIQTIQAEGRAHRDGKAAVIYYAYGEDTVEEDIVRTLLSRIETTKALVGDDTATIQALEQILDTATR